MSIEALQHSEQKELSRYEQVIESGLKSFVEVGEALMAIRDARLYRETHKTFEEYCREKWGMTRMRASQIISASTVAKNVNQGLQNPTSERHARPLSKLPAESQPRAWERAQEIAKDSGETVRARHVESLIKSECRQLHAGHGVGCGRLPMPSRHPSTHQALSSEPEQTQGCSGKNQHALNTSIKSRGFTTTDPANLSHWHSRRTS